MRRRRLVSLAGAGLPVLLGGCLGGNRDASPAPTPPETTDGRTRTSETESVSVTTDDADDSPESRTEPPAYDCEETDRPEPDPPDDEDAIGPATYPDRPESLTDDERMVQYVEAYEAAYRRNSLVAKYWNSLVRFNLSVSETWTYDGPDDAAVVRLQYQYSDEVETRDGVMVGDSPTIFVSYYVDASVVIRAERTGLREDESELRPDDALDPDPWKLGEPLECFE